MNISLGVGRVIIVVVALNAILSLPAGRYAIGVSGGADSVALLRLALQRQDLSLHVVHLDHQARGEASRGDAAFVATLAAEHGLDCTIARREEVERWAMEWPANPSARFRALRLALFGRVVKEAGLEGVLLAHHADDQAETILQRLLRGSGPAGLTGMRAQAVVRGVRLLRPLLGVSAADLRAVLREIDQPWREDASNASDRYGRNRVRRLLHARPELVGALLKLGAAAAHLRGWVEQAAPDLAEEFAVGAVQDFPAMLQDAALRRWLVARGCPASELGPATVGRLLEMALDAASPARQHFPGGVAVRRRGGVITADEAHHRPAAL